MRIIRGKYGGRRLNTPSNLPVRPTTDMAREGLFNIIENNFDIEKLKVLDLYAGTGSISLEFLSRGAEFLTTVDLNSKCLSHLNKVKSDWNIENMIVLKRDIPRYLSKLEGKWDMIFADPPYDSKDISKLPDIIFERNLLNEGGWFILEHGAANNFTEYPRLIDERKYSQVQFAIFR